MKETTLTTLNGIIWLVAGVNVVRIGVLTWAALDGASAWLIVGCMLTLAAFSMMFVKMVFKNVRRIHQFPPERRKVWNCMPLKSFLIMAFMIALGVTMRNMPQVPREFIAFFYVGLGTALSVAGVVYLSYIFATHKIA